MCDFQPTGITVGTLSSLRWNLITAFLYKKFIENPGSQERYRLNNTLVSFDNIPNELQETYLEEFNKLSQLQ